MADKLEQIETVVKYEDQKLKVRWAMARVRDLESRKANQELIDNAYDDMWVEEDERLRLRGIMFKETQEQLAREAKEKNNG